MWVKGITKNIILTESGNLLSAGPNALKIRTISLRMKLR